MDGGLIVFSLLATFFAAALTVPAGFGLATMITPVVFLWLEPHEAVAVVGIVHGSHNAWKLKVLRKSVDYEAVRRYGWAMVVGALLGAALNTAVEAEPLLLIVGIALVILPLLSITGLDQLSPARSGRPDRRFWFWVLWWTHRPSRGASSDVLAETPARQIRIRSDSRGACFGCRCDEGAGVRGA